MKRQLFIYVFALLMCSCINNNDVYQGESDKGGEAYAEQFSNYTSINVNINSQYEGTVYSIFYNNPYEDGDLVKEPYLTGKTFHEILVYLRHPAALLCHIIVI